MEFTKELQSKKEILLHDDRYVRACESIGYEFDEKGIDKVPEEGLADDFQDQIAPVIQEKIYYSRNAGQYWKQNQKPSQSGKL